MRSPGKMVPQGVGGKSDRQVGNGVLTYQVGCPAAVLDDTAGRVPVRFELREVPIELILEVLGVGYGTCCLRAAIAVFSEVAITSLATLDDVDVGVQSMQSYRKPTSILLYLLTVFEGEREVELEKTSFAHGGVDGLFILTGRFCGSVCIDKFEMMKVPECDLVRDACARRSTMSDK